MASLANKLREAFGCLHAGDLGTAERLCGEALGEAPQNPEALHLLGVVRLAAGNASEGVALIAQALEANPKDATMLEHLGLARLTLGDYPAAEAAFRQALASGAAHGMLYMRLGIALSSQGRLAEALTMLREAAARSPREPAVHLNLGNILAERGEADEARACYERILALQPNHPAAHFNLGNLHRLEGRLEEAAASYKRLLGITSGDPDAHCNLGLVYDRQGRLDEAAACYRQALALSKGHAQARSNLGNVLRAQGRIDEAIACYEQAISLKPDYADAYHNRGVAMNYLGRYEEAIASYDKAITLDPEHVDAHLNKGLLLILLGKYEEGWKLYEWRWKKEDIKHSPRNLKQPLWLGEERLAGKTILLYAEQGLGDAIFSCRYVPMVEAMGARVIVEVPSALADLVSTLGNSIRVTHRGSPLPEFDFHCPLMSLPLAFKTTVSTAPARVPYLAADPARQKQWQDRLGAKVRPRIGLVWSGSGKYVSVNDSRRDIPFSEFESITRFDYEYFCLQKEIRPADRELLQECPRIGIYDSELRDFADTAALASEMDLVISVDTAAAHLAGALGKPVWILLPEPPDFLSMIEREDSPWYPTARLFRQPRMGDWTSLIAKVAAELNAVASRMSR